MAGLNPKYVIASDMQQYFVDKDSGEPLANGRLYFYKDNDRTEPKAVYRLSGNEPNYTYTALPNYLTLSSVGTVVDDNNNQVVIYYLPFESEESATIELYYIVCQDEDGNVQWTREAWPNTTSVGDSQDVQEELKNFIPNGQFLAHTDLAASGVIPNGDAETVLAQGGWIFARTIGQTATDTITYTRIDNYDPNIPASPRYEIHIVCSVADTDITVKDLRIRFRDANKFASESQYYTFAFSARAVSQLNATVLINKYFGSGGTAFTPVEIDTVTIDTNDSLHQTSFVFGTNENYTFGSGDDDYVEICIRFPNTTFDVSLTDFMLVTGGSPDSPLVITTFPQTTDASFLAQGVAGWMETPNYAGTDIGKALTLTRSGLDFTTLPQAASIAEMQAASSITTYVTPGRQFYHPSAAQVWGRITFSGATPTLSSPSYHIDSLVDTGTGVVTIVTSIDLGNTTYVPLGSMNQTGVHGFISTINRTANNIEANVYNSSSVLTDYDFCICVFNIDPSP